MRRLKFLIQPGFGRWLGSVMLVLTLIGVTFTLDKRYAVRLLWTFFNGETAIGGWKLLGVPIGEAIALAILCSTVDIINWFLLADVVESKLLRLNAKFRLGSENAVRRGKFYRLALRLPYVGLVILGAVPGKIYFAVLTVKLLQLKRPLSIFLVCLGNSFKMVSFGLGFELADILSKFIGARLS